MALALLLLLLHLLSTHAAILTTSGGRLVDSTTGQPLTLRAVAYSPTAIGNSSEDGDPLGPEHEPTWSRDLEAIASLGANAVRLRVGIDPYVDHQPFLAACAAHSLSVIGGTILRASDNLTSAVGFNSTRARLDAELRSMLDPNRTVALWAVGDELNAPWHSLVCEQQPDDASPCQFGDDPTALYGRVDELCAFVTSHGMLCTSPLAEVPLPASYSGSSSGGGGGSSSSNHSASAWVASWVASIRAATPQLGVHSVSAYSGASFGAMQAAHAAVASTPLLVASFGIDAFDSGRFEPDERAQAAALLERVASLEGAAAAAPPASAALAGGVVLGWRDEWHRGADGLGATAAEAPLDSPRQATRTQPAVSPLGAADARCPDADPARHTACGRYAPTPNATFDGFVNAEWFGLTSAALPCAGSPDALSPREAFWRLRAFWTSGAPAAAPDAAMLLAVAVLAAPLDELTEAGNATDALFGGYAALGGPSCPGPSAATLASPLDAAAGGPFVDSGLSRMQVHGRGLVLCAPTPVERGPSAPPPSRACVPFLVRGVCYSPVPIGEDPGYAKPYGDYFTTQYARIFERDLALMAAMGANTVRPLHSRPLHRRPLHSRPCHRRPLHRRRHRRPLHRHSATPPRASSLPCPGAPIHALALAAPRHLHGGVPLAQPHRLRRLRNGHGRRHAARLAPLARVYAAAAAAARARDRFARVRRRRERVAHRQ